jgi:hypothetical protein
VEDPAGRAVSGARVTLSLPGSAIVHSSALTSDNGEFLFPGLRAGSYDLAVEAPAFAKTTLRNVKVGAAVRIRLPEGPPARVDVSFAASHEEMTALPLPRRDAFSMVELLPGVANNGRAPVGIYGESVSLANITYDGVNVAGAGSTTLAPRTDQVDEASVVTGAVFGNGGAQAEFSAPRGGNAFHGSAYWLAIPSGTAAQYWADNSRNTPASTSVNQLGASLGGPLNSDTAFFFLNYEAGLDRSTVTRTGDVPAAPLASRDPLVEQVLGLIPSDPSGRYRGTQDNGGTFHIGLARLDYLASPRHVFGLTFADRNSTADDPADSAVFGRRPTTTIGVSAPFFAASWRWTPTANLTNQARGGVSLAGIEVRNSLRSRFGFIAILDDPGVSVSQPMVGLDPRGEDDHLRSYEDNLTWAHGRHTLQAGFWLQQYRLASYGFDNGPLDSLTAPRYNVTDIAQGTIGEVNRRFNIASPTSGYSSDSTARSRLAANMISGYVHDEWKLLRSLTVSLGLRYDYLSRATEQTGSAIIPVLNGAASDAVYDKNLPLAFASAGQPLYRKDFDNYSQYVGLAWKPFEKLPLIARGGYSVIYVNDDLLPNLSIYALRNPFQSFNVTTDLSGSPVPLSAAPATPVPVLPASLSLQSLLAFANGYHQQPGTVYAIDWNVRTPNVKYWNVGVGGAVRGFDLDVRYVGNRLEEAPRSTDRNQSMTSPAFLAAFAQVQTALKNGTPTSGFPGLLGGGLCANFNLQNCRPDLHARSLILTGQAGELARWYEGQGYNANGTYSLLGNPLAPNGIDLLSHLGVSRYDALQLAASRRAGKRLSLLASYVFSKVLSNLNDYRLGAIDPYLDLHRPSLEWAPSPFNLTHAVKAMAVYDLPRGWSIAGIMIAQSGAPFSLLSGLGTFDSLADSAQNTVATALTAPQIDRFFGIRKGPGGTVSYVNAPADAFSQPAPGTVGNLQRRMFAGPGAFNLNLGLRKTIPLRERARAELRAESINVLNNVNWLVGDQTYLGGGAFDNNVTQWNAPRTFQFSVRLGF